MTTIVFPTTIRLPASFSLGLVDNVQISTSSYTQSDQTIERPGMRWTASMSWNALGRDDANQLFVLLARLRGRANRLEIWPLFRPVPQGTLRSAVAITGGSFGATSMSFASGPGGTLLVGDFFSVPGPRPTIYTVVANTTIQPGSSATVLFEPPLIAAVGANATVTLTRPGVRMRLTEANNQMQWGGNGLAPGQANGLQLNLIEA